MEFSFDYALLAVTYGKMSLSIFHIYVASFFHEQRLCAGLIYLLEHNCTGKSLSEALIFASTNPQYDNRLFNDL